MYHYYTHTPPFPPDPVLPWAVSKHHDRLLPCIIINDLCYGHFKSTEQVLACPCSAPPDQHDGIASPPAVALDANHGAWRGNARSLESVARPCVGAMEDDTRKKDPRQPTSPWAQSFRLQAIITLVPATST